MAQHNLSDSESSDGTEELYDYREAAVFPFVVINKCEKYLICRVNKVMELVPISIKTRYFREDSFTSYIRCLLEDGLGLFYLDGNIENGRNKIPVSSTIFETAGGFVDFPCESGVGSVTAFLYNIKDMWESVEEMDDCLRLYDISYKKLVAIKLEDDMTITPYDNFQISDKLAFYFRECKKELYTLLEKRWKRVVNSCQNLVKRV